MKLIVGLGNPGEKYEKTRHNLGFMVVDKFLKSVASAKDGVWEENKKLKSDIYIFDWQPKVGKSERVILAKPQTFMNLSGMAVSLISSFYKISPEDVWIVHDELDLPLGNIKIRFGGSGAGHHGVESIINALKTEKFWRFRLGIGYAHNKQEIAKHRVKADEYVLDKFSAHESGTLKHLIKGAEQALETALEKDLRSAMNRFNTK